MALSPSFSETFDFTTSPLPLHTLVFSPTQLTPMSLCHYHGEWNLTFDIASIKFYNYSLLQLLTSDSLSTTPTTLQKRGIEHSTPWKWWRPKCWPNLGQQSTKWCKVFSWLLSYDRINSNVDKSHRHTTPNSICLYCGHALEDNNHTTLSWSPSNRIWKDIGIIPRSKIESLWDLAVPPLLNDTIWDNILLIVIWKIWDAKNSKFFNDIIVHSLLTNKKNIFYFIICTHQFKVLSDNVVASLCPKYLLSRTWVHA